MIFFFPSQHLPKNQPSSPLCHSVTSVASLPVEPRLLLISLLRSSMITQYPVMVTGIFGNDKPECGWWRSVDALNYNIQFSSESLRRVRWSFSSISVTVPVSPGRQAAVRKPLRPALTGKVFFLSLSFLFSQNLAKTVRQQIGICLDHRVTFHSVTGDKLTPVPPLSSGEKERNMIKNSPLRCRGQSRRASPEIPNSSKLLYSLPEFTPLLWVQVVQWLCRLVSLVFFFSSC